jgi:hypothetical protein
MTSLDILIKQTKCVSRILIPRVPPPIFV